MIDTQLSKNNMTQFLKYVQNKKVEVECWYSLSNFKHFIFHIIKKNKL